MFLKIFGYDSQSTEPAGISPCSCTASRTFFTLYIWVTKSQISVGY